MRVWPGDVRESSSRAQWPLGWRSSDPLLARAADHARGHGWLTETRAAQRIVDRRVHTDDYRGRPGRYLPLGADSRPPGRLERSGHRGRILDVR